MKVADLTLEDEFPLHTPPHLDISENYAWCAFDTTTEVGFFCHLGRWSQDRNLWREQIYLYLPDKTVLAYRGFGNNPHTHGPAAGIQKQTCLKPGKHLRIEHKGPIAQYDPVQLANGQADEPFVSCVDVEIEFISDPVPFFYTGSDNTTRGPRDLKHFCGSNWIQGKLPDGSGFALFQTWDRIDDRIPPGLSELTLSTENAIDGAELPEFPAFDSMDDLNKPITISFNSTKGRIDIIGEPLNTMIFSASAKHEVLLGAARDKAPL